MILGGDSMTMYFNGDTKGFEMTLNSQIYVDKSELIEVTNSYINTNQRFICVSRPRRFGKTMALEMLSAYYSYGIISKKLFKNLKISKKDDYEKFANKFNVIFINIIDFFTAANNDVDTMLNNIKSRIIENVISQYPDVPYRNKNDFISVLEDVYKSTDIQFINLIDEWDCIFRELKNDSEAQKKYLDFLRMWMKDKNYIALAYMTGILPIKKYGRHSALNMFYEYSMTAPGRMAKFMGFTEDEVKELCPKHDMDFNNVKAWYDGYYLKNIGSVYNPKSVVQALFEGELSNYWTSTETYEALKEYIELNYDGLKEIIIRLMAGERQTVDINHFSNDMVTFQGADDVLTLLVHLGYLGYDSETKEVFIPNNEIRAEFRTAVRYSDTLAEVAKAVHNSDEILKETIAGNSKRVAELIEKAHLETSHLQYNDENALSYTISLAYYTARNKYTLIRELPAGKGFADLVFLPRKNFQDMPAMVVELKWNYSAKTAIKQIREKNYPEVLKDYGGNILLVGITYNKKTRKHNCRIEKC